MSSSSTSLSSSSTPSHTFIHTLPSKNKWTIGKDCKCYIKTCDIEDDLYKGYVVICDRESCYDLYEDENKPKRGLQIFKKGVIYKQYSCIDMRNKCCVSICSTLSNIRLIAFEPGVLGCLPLEDSSGADYKSTYPGKYERLEQKLEALNIAERDIIREKQKKYTSLHDSDGKDSKGWRFFILTTLYLISLALLIIGFVRESVDLFSCFVFIFGYFYMLKSYSSGLIDIFTFKDENSLGGTKIVPLFIDAINFMTGGENSFFTSDKVTRDCGWSYLVLFFLLLCLPSIPICLKIYI